MADEETYRITAKGLEYVRILREEGEEAANKFLEECDDE